MKDKLTEKQKRFAEEYMKTGNARQAYKNAGYEAKNDKVIDANASRLLSYAKVQNYIAEISEQIKDQKIADIVEMQVKLSNIIRGLTTEQVIVTELIGQGKSQSRVMEKKPSLKDVLKAIDLLAKLTGAYSPETINLVVPVYGGEDELED